MFDIKLLSLFLSFVFFLFFLLRFTALRLPYSLRNFTDLPLFPAISCRHKPQRCRQGSLCLPSTAASCGTLSLVKIRASLMFCNRHSLPHRASPTWTPTRHCTGLLRSLQLDVLWRFGLRGRGLRRRELTGRQRLLFLDGCVAVECQGVTVARHHVAREGKRGQVRVSKEREDKRVRECGGDQ